MNNRPENFIGQAYYQNFEEAVRDVQRMGNGLTSKNKDTVARKFHEKRPEPDILKNTLNEMGQSNQSIEKPNSNERQNIYANDELVKSETNEER